MQSHDSSAEVREIMALAARGSFEEARGRYRRLLATQPAFAPAWLAASHVEMGADRPLEALQLAAKCLELDRSRPPGVLLQMALALRALFHVTEAMVPAREALASPAADADVLDQLGVFFSQCARYPEAFAAHERAVALRPDEEALRFHLLTVARYVGRFDAAEAECDRLAAGSTVNGEVYLTRSHLRAQTPERNHVAQLRQRIGLGDLHGEARVQLHYALGKELEDLGDFHGAFEAFADGARQHRELRRYDVADDVANFDRIRAVFDSDWRQRAGRSNLAARPIFVLGLPRSGTTLVERVLSSHPEVTFSGELRSFGQALDASGFAVAGRPVDERERVCLARSVPPDALGRAYLRNASLMVMPTGRFIDKLPANYLHCALIKAALPEATIVHVSRSPMASCFAMFKTWFNESYPFSYDFGELARYYAAYRRLMSHWSALMPGEIVEVGYESLVANFEPEARRIVASCGLSWDERCLEFHSNPAASTTASSVQVRRPLYSDAVDQWRRYAERLDPLRDALVAAGIPPTECA
jgi:tetratricopeptide (TPR) repeat protein